MASPFRIAALAAAALTLTLSAASAQDLALDLVNGSSHDLERLEAAPAGSGAWEDMLGGAILPAGNRASVPLAAGRDQCNWDFRFALAGADVVEETAVDVCANGGYTLTD